MEYKVTALRDVTVRAYIRFQKPERIGDLLMMRPAEREEWVTLRQGEVRSGLGLVIGVHPRSCPAEMAIHVRGVPMVMSESWSNEDLPKEFFGLFRLEVDSK